MSDDQVEKDEAERATGEAAQAEATDDGQKADVELEGEQADAETDAERVSTDAAETDEDLPYLLRFIGEDNLITGSDYGHQDQSKETNMVTLMRGREDISVGVIEKILSDNPGRFYGL